MPHTATNSLLHRTFPRSGAYVLLVDDDAPSLQQLDELLRCSGYCSVTAGSGKDALLCCGRSRPRVVVTDFGMPELDGCCLARRIRALHPTLPIILLSGHLFAE